MDKVTVLMHVIKMLYTIFLQKRCTSFDLETIDNYVPSDKKLSLIINYIYLTMFLNVQLHVKVADTILLNFIYSL